MDLDTGGITLSWSSQIIMNSDNVILFLFQLNVTSLLKGLFANMNHSVSNKTWEYKK